METKTMAVADAIEAQLNYLVPTDETPYSYTYDPPPGVPARSGVSEPHTVTVRNGRAIAAELSLDREGFLLARQATEVADFYDEAEVKRVYYPEVERLAKAATGAAEIVIFDHTVRNTAPQKQTGRRVRAPAGRVHNDYTEASAPQRVRDLLAPEAAEARLKRRYVEINVWRPITGPVKTSPLAVCDARTVEAQDLVTSELRYPDRIGETYAVTYNPRHRWFYFPDMQADEALFIKCFDSARDGRARISVHTAFDDPTTAPNAPPRESIEVRMFAFF
jgi:hypothetical protein